MPLLANTDRALIDLELQAFPFEARNNYHNTAVATQKQIKIAQLQMNRRFF